MTNDPTRVRVSGPLAEHAVGFGEELTRRGYPPERAARHVPLLAGLSRWLLADGLSADELTIPMRVLAVADVYEALTAERPYRPAWSSDRALEIIRLDVPQRLDQDAFAALKDCVASAAALPPGIQPR